MKHTQDTSRRIGRRTRATAVAIAVLGASAAAHAAVGARVLLQQWNPLTPKQQNVVTLVNDPSVVSDSVQKAWNEARPRLCAQLQAVMGRGGAAGGQTLRDITCLLDPAATFAVTSAGANSMMVNLAISGYVEATSTTPTALGSYADPRFSLALTGHLQMTLAVQADPNHTLRFDKVQFTLGHATIDSHNLSGDILKFVADTLIPFFGGPNYKQMAENAINAIGVEISGRFNNALAPVNSQLRGPSGSVRVGVWGKPDAIIIAFGPRELTPPAGGTMTGTLHTRPGQPAGDPDCASLAITASVQTGPAPLRDPGGYYEPADAPVRQVGTYSAQSAGNGACRYRVSGLAAGWPNELKTRSCGSAGAGHARIGLVGEGWDGHLVVPQPSADRNYFIESPLECAQGYAQAQAVPQKRVTPGDPMVHWDAAALTATPSRVTPSLVPSKPAAAVTAVVSAAPGAPAAFGTTALTSMSSPSALGQANRVALNPQPLPPKATAIGRLAAPAQGSTTAAAPALNWGAVGR